MGTHCFFIMTEKNSLCITDTFWIGHSLDAADRYTPNTLNAPPAGETPSHFPEGSQVSNWQMEEKFCTCRDTTSLKYFLINPLLIGEGTRVQLDSFKASVYKKG